MEARGLGTHPLRGHQFRVLCWGWTLHLLAPAVWCCIEDMVPNTSKRSKERASCVLGAQGGCLEEVRLSQRTVEVNQVHRGLQTTGFHTHPQATYLQASSPGSQSKFYGEGAGECASKHNIHVKYRTFLREKGSRTW